MLKEPNRVDKESPVHSINLFIGQTCIHQRQPLDPVACDRIFMLWLQNDAWYV